MRKLTLRLLVALTVLSAAAAIYGQSNPKPLLQDIKIYNPADDQQASGPLVNKTGDSAAINVAPPSTNAVLADVSVPGYSGIVIEDIEGNRIYDSNSSLPFNPASNVKIATAYAVLKTFGPSFRFMTNVYTDGAFDRETGTINGNLYVSGRDPVFGYEHAITIANELNRLGIRSVAGDLIVTDNFAMNYSGSSLRSGQTLKESLDLTTRSSNATRVWLDHLANSGRLRQNTATPNVSISGSVYVQSIPSNLRLLFTHESTPMREIIKATLCYSNNFLAERLGDMLGGAYAVARIVHLNAGIEPNEFSIQTASGLGYNRVTPSAMMRLLRALRGDLARYQMTYADIMPVAGVDKGTLEGRFDSDFSTGSVVGKTGTLHNTDGGVSALAGEINTRKGRLLFVIFNQRGSVSRFRTFQNFFVSLVQGQYGGAIPFAYQHIPLDARMARNGVSYPDGRSLGN